MQSEPTLPTSKPDKSLRFFVDVMGIELITCAMIACC